MITIPLIKPYITSEVKRKVCEVLDSGYLTEGPVTHEFEGQFRAYIGCKHAIAVTSCTTGLELALRAVGIGSGDEVIIPDFTYPATADAAGIVGAKIVIVDVTKDTMLIDYAGLQKAITKKTKAIIPVALFGNPLDYRFLNYIKQKYKVKIIEDAACAIGAEYNGVKVGNLVDISVFSLHPRKFITTGEGGIITTNSPWVANWINRYKHFGMELSTARERASFVSLGTNCKLSDVLSAIGVVQMRHIEELITERRQLAMNYTGLLAGVKNITLPRVTRMGVHSFQSFCVFVDNPCDVIKKMRMRGIEVQIGTYALHMHKAFKRTTSCAIIGRMRASTYAYRHCLVLPLYHGMKIDDQKKVVRCLERDIEGGEND